MSESYIKNFFLNFETFYMNGGLGEVISQPPLHFDGVGVFPSSNSIKSIKMADVLEVVPSEVVPSEVTTQQTYRGKITTNLTIAQFKLRLGVSSFTIRKNPNTGALCMYDGVNVLGATGPKYDKDLPLEDLQILMIDDEGEDVYVITKRGSGGISDWDIVASY